MKKWDFQFIFAFFVFSAGVCASGADYQDCYRTFEGKRVAEREKVFDECVKKLQSMKNSCSSDL